MRRYLTLPLTVFAAACGSNPSEPQPDPTPTVEATPQPAGRFAPRDDCAKLPGAADFRQRLVEAVQLRDADMFAALSDPGIKLDFGGGGGLDDLRQRLGSGDELWRSLEQVLKLGCTTDPHGNLVIPWLFGQQLGAIDASVALLVTGEDVPILKAPRANAEPLTTISWDLVSAANGLDRKQPYTQVTLPLNQHGYVATDKLRSVLDYRLLASKRTGAWKVEALVAGD